MLGELHGILDRLHEDMAHDTDDTEGAANAAEAFAAKRGPSRDLSHIFIGAAHSLGIPARYVAGYFRHEDGAHARRRRVTPGRRPSCPISAGSPSIRPTAFARPTVMSASPSVSTRLARRRCGGCAMAPGAETLAVAIKVGQ